MQVTDAEVAHIVGKVVPGDSVAAAPVAVWLRPDVKRRLDRVARVEAGPANLCQLPVGPQVAGPHLLVGLEAARREHHGRAGDVRIALRAADEKARDGTEVVDLKSRSLRVVGDLDATFLCDLEKAVGQS